MYKQMRRLHRGASFVLLGVIKALYCNILNAQRAIDKLTIDGSIESTKQEPG